MRTIFNEIQGHLPFDLMSTLAAVAHINPYRVREAKEREALRQATQSFGAFIESNQIKICELNCHVDGVKVLAPVLTKRLDVLEAQRVSLLNELYQVDADIALTKEQVDNHPVLLQQKKDELDQYCRSAQSAPVALNTHEEDLKLISNVDHIRTSAIQAIEEAL